MNAVTTLSMLLIFSSVVNADLTEEQAVPSNFSYGKKGLQYQSSDGNNFLWFGVRLQTRFSNQEIRQQGLPEDDISKTQDLSLNRGRLKLGGHLVSSQFTVYTEYDFTSDTLLDLRASFAFSEWFKLRAGQWKSEFNRERIDSSGAQQFAERSVVTPWFTIDRQKGLMASGRVAGGTAFDSSYWLGRLSGAGRGGDLSDADGFWMARCQWNFSGRVLGFSQSDIGRREQAAGSFAIALVDGASAYTSFSSKGGGQLPGYTEGEPSQYAIRQLLFETAWQSHGFSWQQELHLKKITDRVNATRQKLFGGYAQTGMFFSEVWPSFPKPLELAMRLAYVDPGQGESEEREYTLAANWFFKGHRNKLTGDVSYIKRRMAPENDSSTRLRIQWDWSF